MYAPLYPPFFVLGALSLAVSLGANRFAVSQWWGRPPSVGEEMIERLRIALGLLFPVYLVTTAWGWSLADRHDKSLTALIAPLAVLIAMWALLQLLRFRGWIQYLAGCAIGPCCVRSRWYLKPYDPLELTTDGIRYESAQAKKGYKIKRYRGLAATKADEGTSGWTAAEIEGRGLEAMDDDMELEEDEVLKELEA